jgi:hypothetical protein
MNHRAATRTASVSSRHPAGTAAYCFAAMDEAGDYERADAPTGGTVWDVARALAPAAVVLPGCRQAAILGTASRAGASGFPADWDQDIIIDAVLAVARDPDRITWDPAAWPGDDITRRPGWRAEGTVAAVTITVALREDGEITGAWPDEGPGADRSLGAAGLPPKTPGSTKGEAGVRKTRPARSAAKPGTRQTAHDDASRAFPPGPRQ